MTELNESIRVARPVHEAFAYIADFTTTIEWDSTAIAASKLTAGPIAVGTRFLVRCALPLGAIDLTYEVTRYLPNEQIDLAGSCRLFDVEDSIRFTQDIDGTRIDYRAKFIFPRLVAATAERFRSGLDRMGKASMAGMREALEDKFPPPQASTSAMLGDRLVLPGLSAFTRWGYQRGKQHWHPMSAYMGDKHVVVTGASAGLGYAAALELARRGAALTLVMRNPDKAHKVAAELSAATGNDRIEIQLADLSLLADVDQLSRRLLQRGRPIDVLINNAGALFNERAQTIEGLEQSLALLLLSPYRLTRALQPLLLKAPAPRVVNVVSGGMYSQRLDMATLEAQPGSRYSGSVAYARAKRALMTLTEHWADTWAQDGIVVNAMHPGWADTPGVASSLPRFHRVTRKVLRSPEQGADTMIWLAVATEAGKLSGKLFLDRTPRATHLLAGTREQAGERQALLEFLSNYAPPASFRERGRRAG